MHILAIIQGTYGKRIVQNLRLNGPEYWEVHDWNAPLILPDIIEDPEDFLPVNFPKADLVLSFGESTGVAELIPDITKMSKAKAVIAPIDNRKALPPGLVNQIKEELRTSGIDCVFPLPFCSLTEKASDNKYIIEFAKYFGKPELRIFLKDGRVKKIVVKREAPCGVTRFIKEKLIGLAGNEAEKKAALFHQYYPCLASGKLDKQIGDSILHKAADITSSSVESALDS